MSDDPTPAGGIKAVELEPVEVLTGELKPDLLAVVLDVVRTVALVLIAIGVLW